MKILHLTYDYPDNINPDKTRAIKDIIDATNEDGNAHCISMNRTMGHKRNLIFREGNVTAMGIAGLPMGILFTFTLLKSIKRVLSSGIDFTAFDKVHAHKLTFEGPIAYYLHRKFGMPYIITIQQTDFKVLKYKPLMKSFYFKILREAEHIILISPWMERSLFETFGGTHMKLIGEKLRLIPLIVDRRCIQEEHDNGKYICAFYMRNKYIKIKNIYRVLKAVSLLRETGIIVRLDIAGDGPARHKVESMIKRLNIGEQVKLLGRIDNDKILNLMSAYRGFILCSYPETFGMVYIEALSAGIPVIHSRDTGIDGFFTGTGIGIAVHHNSIKEIIAAIKEINNNPAKFRLNVRKLQAEGCLSRFSKESVKQKYYPVYAKEGAI